MQIYVVRAGDTLFRIARAYNTTPEEIAIANELPDPNRLVVGQALVIAITGSYYYVQPGDSLWLIGRRFGVSYLELARINRIDPNGPLEIGLRVYIPPRPKRDIVSNGYAEPINNVYSENLIRETEKAAPLLTYIAPFSYRATSEGGLVPLNLDNIPNIAARNNNNLLFVITNIESGQFSAGLARSILTNTAAQDALIQNGIAAMQAQPAFSDVHFDFEFIPVDLRDAYTAFIRKAAERFRAAGYMLSVALAPKTSATQPGQWYGAHDYRALGAIADFVVIMTYEWGYSAGPPMAVSPIGPVEAVLRYAISEMPAGKILMGQNLYGYDWTLPYVAGGQYARAVSPQQAIALAARYRAEIQYDYRAEAPFFYYYDENRVRHVVWFEDARSIDAKFMLLKRLNLRGISYWKLGLSFPQNWLLLGDQFNITKTTR